MNLTDIEMKLLELLIGLIVSGLLALITSGVKYLLTQGKAIKNTFLRNLVLSAIGEADKLVEESIGFTQHTLVDGLKAKSADGSLTPDDIAQATKTALTYFDSHITAGAKDILKTEFADIEAYVASLIKAKLGQGVAQKITAMANPLSSSPSSK